MKTRFTKSSAMSFIAAVVFLLWSMPPVVAQTTMFTYQGRLTDGGTAANGNYDLQFELWDSASGGSQIGSAQTVNAVPVSAGVFTVTLDFGANGFPGANRFLEINMRQTGISSFTLLTPRQQVTSTPYAIRSLSAAVADSATNATQLGGTAAGQYVQTNDPRLSDSRTPAPGSSNYIQNATSQQASSNFNISGNGTAGGTLSGNLVNATTKYRINGIDVLSVTGAGSQVNSNTFAGVGAGVSNTPSGVNGLGNSNAFFGFNAGLSNTSGAGNSFFGAQSGQANISGVGNSFFGASAGTANTTGIGDSFFGDGAGSSNTTAGFNSFFGGQAGLFNTVGVHNTFIGFVAGEDNTTGQDNTFVGVSAGLTNTTGASNTLIGINADVSTGSLTNATAIGANSMVNASNSLVLGNNANVGIGTNSPLAKLHIAVNNGNVLAGDAGCGPSFAGIGFVNSFSNCTNYSLLGDGANTYINRPSGGAIFFRQNNGTEVSISAAGTLSVVNVISVGTLGSAGSTSLCRNAFNQISTCSSSLRYKKDLQSFTRGLAVLNSLEPITFRWKADNTPDLGFGAEEVAKVEPLLVTHNASGEVEGVKYDRITVVLVNAVKEQQQQIQRQQEANENLQRQLARQQSEIEGLKQLVRGRHAKRSQYRERLSPSHAGRGQG